MNPVTTLAAVMMLVVSCGASVGAAPDWGVNFWAHDFYTGDATFIDATRTFSYPQEWQDDPAAIPMTDQGVPLRPVKLRSFLGGYPDGVYRLRYEGTGRVVFEGGARLVPESVRTEGGFTYADVQVDRSEADLVEMSFHDVKSDDPVRNVRLISPGYGVDTTRVVRDVFIRRVRPFSTFRFMDWNATNSSKASRWSERRPADYLVQTPGWRPRLPMGGMAYELMVAVCNECGKDMWMCVPHLADDEYMRELAQFLKDRLDPGLKCYVELSNELWNFSQGPELGRKMIRPDWDWNNSDVTLYYGAVAPRVAQMSRIFKEVWPEVKDVRLEIVLAGQGGNAWHCAKALEYYTDHDIEPADVIDALAIAPYFRPQGKYTDYDEMMGDMLETLESRLLKGIRRHKDLADQHGLKLHAYEGGQHFWYNVVDTTKNPDADGFIARAQDDPRMREAYRRYFALWETENPGGLFMHYTFTSGSWGLLKSLDQAGSVKWDAVMTCLLPAGDTNLDGKADFDDFLVLKENFGQPDCWWEQGDFNGDNRVDRKDLELLRRNLAGLSTEQQGQVRALAQRPGD